MGDIREILERQRAFFREGNTLGWRRRRAALRILGSTIKEFEPEIAEALRTDLGKSETEGYMCEIGVALSELRFAQQRLRRWARPRRAATPAAQFPAHSFIIPEPYGNVLIMAPWNYPFLLCISPLIAALAAGNTAVIKPSAYAPATSAVIRRIIDATFTEDWVAVVEGGREENSQLLSEKWDYIFFTGSKTVGKLVMQKASEHLTPVSLELGGKSPVIVDSNTDLQVAAARIVFGKYLNLGQTCVAPDHVFVDSKVKDAFIEACKDRITGMFGEDPLANPDYGRIVNEKHYTRLCETLDEVKDKIIFGGERRDEQLRISPAILDMGECSPALRDFRVMREEIFGPVLPVISYGNLDDVVDFIEGGDKPLAAYFFTDDKQLQKTLLRHLHFGGGCINDTIIHLATDAMPFGGVGGSGMGAYHGKWGFDTFTHYKSIVSKPTWLDLKMRYQPYTEKSLKLIKKFLR